MTKTVSIYDAKARLSALVREARDGRCIVITVHGVPAAELRPISPLGERSLELRMQGLEVQGVIAHSRTKPHHPAAFPIGERKKGALARFLADRD